MMNVRPPALIAPVRAQGVLLGSIEYEIVPLPVPVVAPLSVTQETVLDAVQAHPAPAVIAMLPLEASADTETLVGDSEYEHAPASCVTVNVCPPIVSVPVRDVDDRLAATL
jgi:hypothetical protein